MKYRKGKETSPLDELISIVVGEVVVAGDLT
jgi:hypothetical protein